MWEGVLIRLSIVEKDRAKGSSDCKAKVTQRFMSPHQVQVKQTPLHPSGKFILKRADQKNVLPS